MYRPPSRNMQRPSLSIPSRPRLHNLTVNTSSLQPTQPSPASLSATSSTTPEQPYPKYPIPIPLDKQDKALKLYKQYREAKREEGFAQLQSKTPSEPSDHHGYFLNVPTTPAPQSATSRTSSKRGGRASVSVTDMSSVMSWEGNESPSAKPNTDLSTYDGKKVKHRTRKRFNDTARARTALIRHLGSCWPCNKRRVQCDLEKHHDIQTLDALLQAKSSKSPSHSQQQLQSPIAGFTQQNARTASVEHATKPITQTDAFLGLDLNQNDQFLQISPDLDISQLDIPSHAFGDNTPQDTTASAPLYYEQPDLSALDINPYASYQNGDMFHIGTLRADRLFDCDHLFCSHRFTTLEALQSHFDSAHFSFTRIDPAHRYVCGSCSCVNELSTEPCYNCAGQIEIWICGNYIRPPSYHHYSPNGQDPQSNFTTSAPCIPSAYDVPQGNFPDDDPSNYNGGADQGDFTFQPPDNAYGGGGPGPGSQGYGYTPDPYTNPPNGTQYQGNTFQRAFHIISAKSHPLQPHPQTSRFHKLLLALSFFFLALSLYLSSTWLLSKLQDLPRHISGLKTNLPVIGFVGIVASAAMYSSVMQRKTAVRSGQKCPLHWMGARVRAPDTYVWGGRFS